jgi:hypothetical protein
MPKYRVTVKEIWERSVIVTADDEEEAVEKVYSGMDYQEDEFTFDRFIKDETTVEETE